MKKLFAISSISIFALLLCISCQNQDSPQGHTHDFSVTKYDTTNHWEECECGEKDHIEEHLLDNGVITIKPTESSTGLKVYSCLECPYEKEEIIPKTGSREGFAIYSLEMMGTYGDSNLIQYGNYDILVDGGTSSDAAYIKEALNNQVQDHTIELLVISHPDSDHYQGITSLSTFQSITDIGLVVQNDNTGLTEINNIVSNFPSAKRKGILEVMGDPSLKDICVDNDFSIHFLNQKNYSDVSASKNNRSIGFTINYKNTIVFMGGDMEKSACDSIIQMNPSLTTEDNFVIFKALHHGSAGSNYDNFLNYLKPDLCFITTGMSLSEPHYVPSSGVHPYLDALKRLGSQTKNVYWSGINGNLTISCDGENAAIEGRGRSRDYNYMEKENNTYTYIPASRSEEKNCTLFESKYYQVFIDFLNAPDFAGIRS